MFPRFSLINRSVATVEQNEIKLHGVRVVVEPSNVFQSSLFFLPVFFSTFSSLSSSPTLFLSAPRVLLIIVHVRLREWITFHYRIVRPRMIRMRGPVARFLVFIPWRPLENSQTLDKLLAMRVGILKSWQRNRKICWKKNWEIKENIIIIVALLVL